MGDTRASDDIDPFSLSGPVGRFGANDRADVIKAQTLLANAGYLDLPPPGIPTGWPGADLVSGITRLQKDSVLAADGLLLPLPYGGIGSRGEGATLQYLKDTVGPRIGGPAAPTQAQGDAVRSTWQAGPATPAGHTTPHLT